MDEYSSVVGIDKRTPCSLRILYIIIIIYTNTRGIII